MRRPHLPRAAAALAALAATGAVVGACAKDAELRLVTPAAAAPFMARYVALGNSITAGYQSDGINDSTQARSYAFLLAEAAGVPFRVPALNKPGCAAPIVVFSTGARVGGAAAGQCFGRADTSYTNQLNNVAVPGANSFDPTGQPGGRSNVLTTLILGGRTQVERALDLDPTFATVWIGNNDVLGFALAGDSVTRAGATVTARATDSATFAVNYASTLTQLRSRNANLRGVLIGVIDVTNAPILIPVSVFNPAGGGAGPAAFNPVANAVVTQLFGRPVQFAPNCAGSQAAVAFPALRTIAAGANAQLAPGAPFTFVCNDVPGTTITTTPGVLDDGERAFFVARVAAYNAFIKAAADSINFAYYDPNPVFADARAAGQIPAFPLIAGPAANPARPFGPLVSNDGVHPGSPAHTVIAKALVGVINAKYSDAGLDASRVRNLEP